MPPVTVSGNFMYQFYNTPIIAPDFSLIDLSLSPQTSGIFRECSKLVRIEGVIDLKRSTAFQEFNNATKLTTMFVKNLGGYSSATFYVNLSPLTNLSVESLTYLVDNLFDRASAGYPSVKITFGTTLLNKLTAEQKSAITAKGFTYS